LRRRHIHTRGGTERAPLLCSEAKSLLTKQIALARLYPGASIENEMAPNGCHSIAPWTGLVRLPRSPNMQSGT